MFLVDANDGLDILRSLVEDAVAAGAKELGVEVERDGTLVFNEHGAHDLAERRAEWLACQAEPETAAIVRTLALHIASFASQSFTVEWSTATVHVRFRPEPARFGSPTISFFAAVGYLRDHATARPDLRIELRDHASGAHVSLAYPQGALDRLLEEAGLCWFNHRPMRFVATTDGGALDVAFAWKKGPGLQVVALVNGARTPNGGSHVKGVWEGIARALETRLQKMPTQGPPHRNGGRPPAKLRAGHFRPSEGSKLGTRDARLPAPRSDSVHCRRSRRERLLRAARPRCAREGMAALAASRGHSPLGALA
jgi:hypothetical protein